jgi:hypothetical protein
MTPFGFSLVLRRILTHGGVGSLALNVWLPASSPELAYNLNFHPLVDWVRNDPRDLHDRFLVLGLLFDANALHTNVMALSGNAEVFSAGCSALVDLDSLHPLPELLKMEIVASIVWIPAPQVLSHCTAWLRVIGMVFPTLANVNKPLVQRAGAVVVDIIRRFLVCESWEGFMLEALVVIQNLLSEQRLQELFVWIKTSIQASASIHMQVDQIFALVSAKDEEMTCRKSGQLDSPIVSCD